MAMIKCAECGKEISDKAAVCVNCGCPVSLSKTQSDKAGLNVEEMFQSYPQVIMMDLDAVVSGEENGKTRQTVFVRELGRNVSFSVPNNIQAGQSLRMGLKDEKYSSVMFKITSVSKEPASAPAPAAAPASAPQTSGRNYAEIKADIQRYRPNMFSNFLRSRRFYSLMILYFGFAIWQLVESGVYDASVALGGLGVFFIPLLIAHFLYPLHHVKKYLRKHGLEEEIRNSVNVAICAYNLFPKKKMRKYISRLNGKAGYEILRQLSESKSKK